MTCCAAAFGGVACGRAGARALAPQPCPTERATVARGNAGPSTATTAKMPAIRLVLRPEPGATPRVHIDLHAQGSITGPLRLTKGSIDDVTNITARDAQGALATVPSNSPPGLTVTFTRPPVGALEVSYDVRATANPGAITTDVVVAEDRFRALGERVVLLPSGMENEKAAVTVVIDGAAIVAPRFASSLGLGPRTREGYGRTLVRAAFVAGSLGGAVFDEGIDHDETVWLGYTSFDPRPAAAEVATVRTGLREMWHGGGEQDFTLLFASSPRPVGAYSLVPRASSLLVHLGPSEPWSAALRVGVTQHLLRAWIGGELRLAPPQGATEMASLWFSEGVLRYFAGHALRRLGTISVEDARDFVNGLLSAQATSLHRGKSNATLATLAEKDPRARAHLMAHGALYALRLSGVVRARSKGQRSLDAVVLQLMEQARSSKGALPLSAWVDAVAGEVGAAEKTAFDRIIIAGDDVALAPDALGPCFRGALGEYTDFNLGFDLEQTVESAARTPLGIDATGPAAAAGLLATDVLEDATFRYGHAETPVILAVEREGQKAVVRYLPRGARGKGLIYTRKTGVPDTACGDVIG
jgi:hypothetical protein